MAYKTLNLDLAKSPILKSIVYGRIGDSDMQTVTVNITSRDTPVDLTGFIITFEGITNGEKTKVFDVDGISSTDEGLKKGTFDYTFPNMAFAVGGSYEIAYFSIVKGDKRDTTGEFDIIVGSNADIDAAQAETIITEYNKLVKELHAITDKYISDSDAKFVDMNKKITDLQTKITQYQNTVKNTVDSAVSTINATKDSAVDIVGASANSAIDAVDKALKEFESGDFYSKSEANSKFVGYTILQANSDLNDITTNGFYSNRKETIINIPGDSTGTYFTLTAEFTSSGLNGTQIYKESVTNKVWIRSRNNTNWSQWSLVVNDSEVVHLTGDETIEGNKDFTGELKTSGNPIYGVTTNNGWYEEKLGDGFYRWTQIFKVSANIAAASGSLYNSDTLTIPAAPTDSANVYRAITILSAPWPCWSSYFATAGGFRLLSTVVRAAGEVTLEAVLYGSKN
ncbi:BppU family phage baseplate upper protein [Lactococcus garvieae]|uniref:Prophage Lp1 protein 54 n=1 Tax=Lactococcus garvieae DCC43 TaxID=1231377 RepID=K2PK15_9LACT|nr:BppU family phage baseplate upper protein [Lactococcus garvieae]EKF51710.1 prophage Lp1 protein 54 [Lactococcus garvieae DCC43]